MAWDDRAEFSTLLGKTLTVVERIGDEAIVFRCDDGTAFKMLHNDDCCESVAIESIVGDLTDLIGSPITMAEESTSDTWPSDAKPPGYTADSFTWTFYKLATVKGYVTIRWLGESNGYYSESVDFEKVK